MRRMLSDAQVRYLRNKQDKMSGGYGISISSDNAINAVPVPQYTALLIDLANLSPEEDKDYTSLKVSDLNGLNIVVITVNVGAGIIYSTAVACNLFSDIPQPVAIPVSGGEILFVFDINKTTVYNNSNVSLNQINIYKM